jgi:hypothetical protein
MRTALKIVALVSLIACGGSSTKSPVTETVVGVWALQTYNGGTLPFTGNLNANGSRDQVTSGSIRFDTGGKYVLGISIVRSSSTGVTSSQDFSEVGSYTGDIKGVVLRPNDFSGNGQLADPPVPATIASGTLSFAQQGKALTFKKQ